MTDIEDAFSRHSRSLTAPPDNAAAIVPRDDAPLAQATRAVFVGTGGTLRVRMLGSGEVALVGVAAGTLLPVRITHVLATGTTAADLVGLW